MTTAVHPALLAYSKPAYGLAILAAYLLGAVPFGLIIARAHGKDLRSIGSGNIGATNVARALGRKWAYVCFALDLCKGMLPTLATVIALSRLDDVSRTARLSLSLAVGVAAILGHIFPVYLKFRGGKGVTTSLGVAFGLWPWYTVSAAVAFATWGIVLAVWRYVSLASILASLAFCATLIGGIALKESWVLAELWPLLPVGFAIVAMVIVRHRTNLQRLIAGTENKIGGGQ